MQYQEEQKYISDHKEELERLLSQEQAAVAGEVPGSLWEAIDQFKGKKEGEEEEAQKKAAGGGGSDTGEVRVASS